MSCVQICQISLQYKCGHCSELFRHREYLRRHIRMSCETKKAGQKDTRVACEECGLLLTAKQMFDHRLTHGKDSIPCPQPGCSHVSKSKKHAHQHQTRKHIMATCDICGWHGTKYGMTRHKKTHLENDKVSPSLFNLLHIFLKTKVTPSKSVLHTLTPFSSLFFMPFHMEV